MTTLTAAEQAPRTPAQRELGFRIHALVFVPVILAQIILNALTGGHAWSLWSLAGWGIGLAAHWFFVLGPGARHNRKR